MELIERALLLAKIDPDEYYHSNEIKSMLENIPTVDAVPVVHGKWIHPHWRNSDFCYNCSACNGESMHKDYRWADKGIYPICPNCGAKMDLED